MSIVVQSNDGNATTPVVASDSFNNVISAYIAVQANNGNATFSPTNSTSTTTVPIATMSSFNLADMDMTGINNNDIMVYNATIGKFSAIDMSVINDNDGGTF